VLLRAGRILPDNDAIKNRGALKNHIVKSQMKKKEEMSKTHKTNAMSSNLRDPFLGVVVVAC